MLKLCPPQCSNECIGLSKDSWWFKELYTCTCRWLLGHMATNEVPVLVHDIIIPRGGGGV